MDSHCVDNWIEDKKTTRISCVYLALNGTMTKQSDIPPLGVRLRFAQKQLARLLFLQYFNTPREMVALRINNIERSPQPIYY